MVSDDASTDLSVEPKGEPEGKARGGYARAEVLTPSQRSDIARRAALSRWEGAALRATHEGDLPIGDVVISCAVLNNGQRVLSQSGFMKALGRARQAKGRAYYRGDVNLPAFLTAQNLRPFIPNDLVVTSSQIEFRAKNGTKAYGYAAELLPKVVTVFLDADRADVLKASQRHIAERAHLLGRALMNVAIVALVDEVTGYQEIRDRDELQAILAAYIAKELMPWTSRFPLEFYKEMFRLRNWPFSHISKVKGPRYAGKLTNELIYKKLPPGVLTELRRLNPPNEKWQRKHKHFQFLTSEIGNPHLEKQVAVVTTLMRISPNWRVFERHFRRAFPDKATQLPLPGMEEEGSE